MAKTCFATESRTIILDGNVEHPTNEDWQRINPILNELSAKHENEDGIIAYRTNKRSGYKKLTIEWRSKPKLEREASPPSPLFITLPRLS